MVVCLPLSSGKQAPSSTQASVNPANAANATVAPDSTAFPLHLSRHQRDVVQSVAEYLSASARCHIVVLRGVADEGAAETASSSTAAPTSSAAPAAVTRDPSGIFGHFGHSG